MRLCRMITAPITIGTRYAASLEAALNPKIHGAAMRTIPTG
jgi:hypothetical protein